jgi:valyl-tRNA synthetase
MAAYKFKEAAGAIYQFVWGTFCDWYLEFTKPVLQAGGEEAAEIRKTTAWVLQQILLLLNPFMPFITEELHEALLGQKEMLLGARWPVYADTLAGTAAGSEIGWLIRLISEIRSVRADMNVPAGAKIKLLVKDANAETQTRLKTYEEIIKRMARLESIAVTGEVPKGSLQTVLDEALLILPIADIIDLDAERARLKKQVEKIDQDIEKTMVKLNNKQFVDNAPEEIVVEYRERVQESEQIRQKLTQALKQLESA